MARMLLTVTVLLVDMFNDCSSLTTFPFTSRTPHNAMAGKPMLLFLSWRSVSRCNFKYVVKFYVLNMILNILPSIMCYTNPEHIWTISS